MLCFVVGVIGMYMPFSSESIEVRVSVYTTDDIMAYMDYTNELMKADADILKILEEDLHDKVKPLLDDNWFVQTSNPQTEEVYDRQPLVDGCTLVSAPEDASLVKFGILKGSESISDIVKEFPQWQLAQGFLVRDRAQ